MSSAELYINLANICSNWNALNRLSNGSAGAVVKANAYGLGIKEVGISLAKAGARDFFVAVAEEGADLRRALGAGPNIYISHPRLWRRFGCGNSWLGVVFPELYCH